MKRTSTEAVRHSPLATCPALPLPTINSRFEVALDQAYHPFMEFLLKLVVLLASGLFSGAALYLTAIEHPARMSLDVSFALQEFRPSYKRAAPLQASLAIICFLCSVAVWRLTNRWEWLAGGSLVGVAVPITLVFIMPTNRLLLNTASTPDDDTAFALLTKWGRLHAIRTYLSLLGFLVLLVRCVRT